MARQPVGAPYTWAMKTLALVSAVAATGHDDDLDPLLVACHRAGFAARSIAWDDATVSWSRFDAALLRSPWDYTERLPEFLHWCVCVERDTHLLNPLQVVRWNTDKHYLAELQTAGVPIVPTCFIEPDAEPLESLQAFLASDGLDTQQTAHALHDAVRQFEAGHPPADDLTLMVLRFYGRPAI